MIMQKVFFDHIGALFGNHNRWRIRVAADDVGHNACIDHAQSTNTMHLQAWIDHGHPVVSRAHFASARRMVNGLRIVLCHTPKEIVAEKNKAAAAGYNCRIKCRINRLKDTGLGDLVAESGALNLK